LGTREEAGTWFGEQRFQKPHVDPLEQDEAACHFRLRHRRSADSAYRPRQAPPVAGDDAEVKAASLGLASDIDFDTVDAGPLSAARDLEDLAMMWIRLAYSLGNEPDIAFALLRRGR